MFSVGVFSHKLKIDDALIGLMSCMSKILAGFIYAFASTDFVFYLGESLLCFNNADLLIMFCNYKNDCFFYIRWTFRRKIVVVYTITLHV